MTLSYQPFSPSSFTYGYTYEQCIKDCKAQGGYEQECRPACQQFPKAVDYFPDVTYSHFLNWFMSEAKELRKGMWR